MEHISFQTSWVLNWLFDSTICISILICLILTIKTVTKGKLPAWWSYGLWLILLLRMLMPWGIESRMSPFNYLPVPLENESYIPFLIERHVSIPLIQDSNTSAKITTAPTSREADLLRESSNRYHHIYNSEESSRFQFSLSISNALLILWLTGVMLFGIVILFRNLRFWLKIRRLPSANDHVFLDLFEECKLSLAIRKNIAVIVTDNVKSPSLFGFVKPRLLLPPHLLDTLRRDELRYVFLHELSHLKRHDIVVSWLVTIFQIVYWFNPFVWYAFHHLRVDQEAACDAYVLSRTKQAQPADYANTIVGLLERFVQNRQLPSLVGIIEDRSQIRRRIAMIMSFKRYTLQMKCASIFILLIVGLIFLTSSSGKADADRTEIADDLKESLFIEPNDGQISNRHDNNESYSEGREALPGESSIARTGVMEKTIGEIEEADINLDKEDTEGVQTQVDPIVLKSDYNEVRLAGFWSPGAKEPETEPGMENSVKETVEIDLAKATTQHVETQEDSLIVLANNTQEIHSENKISEIEEPESETDIEHSEAVQKGEEPSVDHTSRGLSDSKKPGGLPEKYNLDNELESIDQINTIGGKKWQEVDDQSIILRVSWKYYYLLVLRQPIGMKYSNPSVGLSSTSSITAGIDRIYVEPSSSTQGYIIEKIYKLDGRKQAKEIKERLRKSEEADTGS